MSRDPRIASRAAVCTLLCVLTFSTWGHAQQSAGEEETDNAIGGDGLELSIRTGYATGRGPLNKDESLSEAVSGAMPLGTDLGYRFDRWLLGGYAQAALAINGATTNANCADCVSTWLRLGLAVEYTLHKGDGRAFWVGMNSGRQWLNTSVDAERRLSRSSQGWEYLGLSIGSSLQIMKGVTLGPFSTFSVGGFDVAVSKCGAERLCSRAEARVETRLDDLAIHTWFTTGLRISVLP